MLSLSPLRRQRSPPKPASEFFPRGRTNPRNARRGCRQRQLSRPCHSARPRASSSSKVYLASRSSSKNSGGHGEICVLESRSNSRQMVLISLEGGEDKKRSESCCVDAMGLTHESPVSPLLRKAIDCVLGKSRESLPLVLLSPAAVHAMVIDFERQLPRIEPLWQNDHFVCSQCACHVEALLRGVVSGEYCLIPVSPEVHLPVDTKLLQIQCRSQVERKKIIDWPIAFVACVPRLRWLIEKWDLIQSAMQVAQLFKLAAGFGARVLRWSLGDVQRFGRLLFIENGLPEPRCPDEVWYQLFRECEGNTPASLDFAEAINFGRHLIERVLTLVSFRTAGMYWSREGRPGARAHSLEPISTWKVRHLHDEWGTHAPDFRGHAEFKQQILQSELPTCEQMHSSEFMGFRETPFSQDNELLGLVDSKSLAEVQQNAEVSVLVDSNETDHSWPSHLELDFHISQCANFQSTVDDFANKTNELILKRITNSKIGLASASELIDTSTLLIPYSDSNDQLLPNEADSGAACDGFVVSRIVLGDSPVLVQPLSPLNITGQLYRREALTENSLGHEIAPHAPNKTENLSPDEGRKMSHFERHGDTSTRDLAKIANDVTAQSGSFAGSQRNAQLHWPIDDTRVQLSWTVPQNENSRCATRLFANQSQASDFSNLSEATEKETIITKEPTIDMVFAASSAIVDSRLRSQKSCQTYSSLIIGEKKSGACQNFHSAMVSHGYETCSLVPKQPRGEPQCRVAYVAHSSFCLASCGAVRQYAGPRRRFHKHSLLSKGGDSLQDGPIIGDDSHVPAYLAIFSQSVPPSAHEELPTTILTSQSDAINRSDIPEECKISELPTRPLAKLQLEAIQKPRKLTTAKEEAEWEATFEMQAPDRSVDFAGSSEFSRLAHDSARYETILSDVHSEFDRHILQCAQYRRSWIELEERTRRGIRKLMAGISTFTASGCLHDASGTMRRRKESALTDPATNSHQVVDNQECHPKDTSGIHDYDSQSLATGCDLALDVHVQQTELEQKPAEYFAIDTPPVASGVLAMSNITESGEGCERARGAEWFAIDTPAIDTPLAETKFSFLESKGRYEETPFFGNLLCRLHELENEVERIHHDNLNPAQRSLRRIFNDDSSEDSAPIGTTPCQSKTAPLSWTPSPVAVRRSRRGEGTN